MKIRIKTYNGELPSYLTVGKVYEFIKVGKHGGTIWHEDGSKDYVILDCCDHLNGGSWEVVSE